MNVHYLQHVHFEGPGSIRPCLERRGHRLTATRLYLSENLPAPEKFDWLIVMGDPMGVFDEDRHPWLTAEKAFIRAAVTSGKRVLGICLGAQLIAAAMEAAVTRNKYREIGWFPIERMQSAVQARVGAALPRRLEVFHWHGDTFDLPAGSIALAASEACGNQGFVLDDRIVGLQFHLESTLASAQALINNCRHELDGSRFVQSEDQILADPGRFERIHTVMDAILLAMEAQRL